MATTENDTKNVKILPADKSLQRKLGNASLDQILSPAAVSNAQKVIDTSADSFHEECLSDLATLAELAINLKTGTIDGQTALSDIAHTAFSIKSMARIGSFTLAGTIADSLNIFAENRASLATSPSTISIIEWHINSLNKILRSKLQGDGGEVGKLILQEIEKINPKPKDK